MRVRRYYRKGVKYPYTFTQKYYDLLVERRGAEEAEIIDTAEREIILDKPEEQKVWFNDCCKRVIENPGFYLENLEYLQMFKVKLANVLPKDKFPKKRKDL